MNEVKNKEICKNSNKLLGDSIPKSVMDEEDKTITPVIRTPKKSSSIVLVCLLGSLVRQRAKCKIKAKKIRMVLQKRTVMDIYCPFLTLLVVIFPVSKKIINGLELV